MVWILAVVVLVLGYFVLVLLAHSERLRKERDFLATASDDSRAAILLLTVALEREGAAPHAAHRRAFDMVFEVVTKTGVLGSFAGVPTRDLVHMLDRQALTAEFERALKLLVEDEAFKAKIETRASEPLLERLNRALEARKLVPAD